MASGPKSLLIHNFRESLFKFLDTPSLLSEMSLKALSSVDCFGVNRISSAMLGITGPFSIRRATRNDLGLYFSWVNDPLVRSVSLQSSPISFEDHCRWFSSRLSSNNVILLILSDSLGSPVGQIRFERDTYFSRCLSEFFLRPVRSWDLAYLGIF